MAPTPTAAPRVDLEGAYAADVERIRALSQQLRKARRARRGHDQTRRLADELTAAVAAATATAVRALTLARTETVSGRRDVAGRAVPATVHRWMAELVRLADVAVWAARLTADQPGVLAPTVVRVDSRAATGPPTAGLAVEPDRPGTATGSPRTAVPPQQRVVAAASPAARARLAVTPW